MDFPRLQAKALTPEEWTEYTEKHGHPPTWRPHEGPRGKNKSKDKEQ